MGDHHVLVLTEIGIQGRCRVQCTHRDALPFLLMNPASQSAHPQPDALETAVSNQHVGVGKKMEPLAKRLPFPRHSLQCFLCLDNHPKVRSPPNPEFGMP
jgi:hypothetical protein